MNKLRLIKIYELRKQVHPIEEYIISLSERIDGKNLRVYIDYRVGINWYFTYSLVSDNIFLSPYFNDLLYGYFNTNRMENIEIIRYLFDKHFKSKINE